MAKQRVLIPLDGSDFSSQILTVVRDYFRPEDVELILIQVAKPVLIAAETPGYTDLYAEQMYLGTHGSYTPHLEHQWAVSTQEMETYRKELQVGLDQQANRLREQGYQVQTEVHFGEPAQRIVNFINDMRIDLVAMATHGRTGIGRLVLGSVAERVLRSVEVPVLLWRSTTTTQAAASAAETLAEKLSQSPSSTSALQIAVATDGSSFSRRAVETARWLTQSLNASLSVLVTAKERDDISHSQQITQEMATLVAELANKVEIVPLVGYTDEVVLNYLGAKPVDLLIIGAFDDRGTGAMHSIGVTAQRLVQHAPTSVLMMKGSSQQFHRILVAAALDDETVVTVATQLARQLGTQLDLLHVLPPSAATYLDQGNNEEIAAEKILAQNTRLSSVLREWTGQLTRQGFGEENIHLHQGEALHTILETLRTDPYDLVIVGSQSGAGHFLGSVANGVVKFADQSVFVVRTKEE
ncbi:MAG: universal stress protein [Caldilineaceae bacterium]|nr:universal stress protein [Caldilineaceae bacterium]